MIGGVPITDDPDVPPVRQKTFVRRDYDAVIHRLLGRIESLEATRQKLISGMKVDITNSDGSLAPTVIELVAVEDGESAD